MASMDKPPARMVRPPDLETPDLLLIDVREPAEFAAGHVPGAVNIPIVDLPAKLDDLIGRSVVVMCGGITRGRTGAEILRNSGVTDVAVLDGGTQAWADWSGHALETS